jgi:hypothetical protein
MKVQVVTPYRVSHLQRYGVTVRGNVTGVYPLLEGRPPGWTYIAGLLIKSVNPCIYRCNKLPNKASSIKLVNYDLIIQ